MTEQVPLKTVYAVTDEVMKRILHLGQSSLSEHQYKSFRKLTMDFFQEGKRALEQGRCGEESKTMARGGGDHDCIE